MGHAFHVQPYNITPRRTRVATPIRLQLQESNSLLEAAAPLPSSQITVPIESLGFEWRITNAMEDEATSREEDEAASRDHPDYNTERPYSLISHFRGPVLSDFRGEPMEINSQTESVGSIDEAPAILAEETSPDITGENEGSSTYDPRIGIGLLYKIIDKPRDLDYRLWRVAGEHALTNVAMEAVMRAIRMTTEIREVKQLPKEMDSLHNQIHLHEIELSYVQRCSKCRQYKIWKYSRDSRNEVNKDRKCCGEKLLNTEDHFMMLNPSQVFSLALPKNLRRRRLRLLSPHEKHMFNELNLKAEDDVSITINYDRVAVFKSSGRNAWPILATNDGFQVQNTVYIKLSTASEHVRS